MHPVRDRLTPAERALWRRVALTVRARPGKTVPEGEPVRAAMPAPAIAEAVRGEIERVPAPSRRIQLPAYVAPPHPEDATLDGGWDRRMRGGRIAPDRVIDLHGHGVEEAHRRVETGLRDAADTGARVVLVVTGKGTRGPEDRRGVIRANLADWLQLSRLRPLIAAMRPAHPRHGGGGAFYVVLRRAR